MKLLKDFSEKEIVSNWTPQQVYILSDLWPSMLTSGEVNLRVSDIMASKPRYSSSGCLSDCSHPSFK